VYLAPFARDLRLDESVLAEEQRTQLALLKARRARYTAVRPPIDPAGRTVILVDDGLATGSTMIAAVRSMKAQRAGRIVVAVAVAPPDTIKTIGLEADEVVCLYAPVWFGAVGAFFEDFSEVTDDVVVDLLRTSVTTPVRPGREKAG
jgi:predicted phosphoribosyltransferase